MNARCFLRKRISQNKLHCILDSERRRKQRQDSSFSKCKWIFLGKVSPAFLNDPVLIVSLEECLLQSTDYSSVQPLSQFVSQLAHFCLFPSPTFYSTVSNSFNCTLSSRRKLFHRHPSSHLVLRLLFKKLLHRINE